jgi:hypothetical protein
MQRRQAANHMRLRDIFGVLLAAAVLLSLRISVGMPTSSATAPPRTPMHDGYSYSQDLDPGEVGAKMAAIGISAAARQVQYRRRARSQRPESVTTSHVFPVCRRSSPLEALIRPVPPTSLADG